MFFRMYSLGGRNILRPLLVANQYFEWRAENNFCTILSFATPSYFAAYLTGRLSVRA